VDEIIEDADAALTAWFDGGAFDFHYLQATINAINENATSGVLFQLAILPAPPGAAIEGTLTAGGAARAISTQIPIHFMM
jgi:hypothetical protein